MSQSKNAPVTLVDAAKAPRAEIEAALQRLDLPKPTHDRIFKILGQLPQLRVSVADVNALGFSVDVVRLNPSADREHRIFAPRYPKPQTEGFFLLVTQDGSDEIAALKRIGWPSGNKAKSDGSAKLSIRSSIKLAEHTGMAVTIRIISDSYVGMEWIVSKCQIPAPPQAIDEGKKA
jgi:antiviral helicase SLH1